MKNTTTLSGFITKLFACMLLISIPVIFSAASYSYLDAGDRFFINKFGSDNQYVEVIRKLGGSQVKVRDLNTYETEVVYASKLLTRSELRNEEFENKAIGTVAVLGFLACLAAPEQCKQ